MGTVTLPKTEGLSGARRLYGDEAAGPPLQKLKGGASLADLQQDYALFTYAPLFLHGGLEHNPVQEWINEHNHKQIVFIFQVQEPILRLCKDPMWDLTLWAVEKEHWPSLALHIGSMAMINRAKKTFARAICQDIPVRDVAAKTESKVTVSTFGVDTNIGCLAFKQMPNFNKGVPTLVMFDARDETKKLAAALLACNPNPYQGLQRPPWEKLK